MNYPQDSITHLEYEFNHTSIIESMHGFEFVIFAVKHYILEIRLQRITQQLNKLSHKFTLKINSNTFHDHNLHCSSEVYFRVRVRIVNVFPGAVL